MTAGQMQVRKIAAWVPFSAELMRELEPVHVEGGRCELMALAYRRRLTERRMAALRSLWPDRMDYGRHLIPTGAP